MKSIKLKNEGSLLLAKNEVRADFFSGSLTVFRNRKPTGECWRVMVQNAAFSNWRRGRGSNPRDRGYLPTRFRVERFQPDSATSPFMLVVSEYSLVSNTKNKIN